jgi:hypothetical protein
MNILKNGYLLKLLIIIGVFTSSTNVSICQVDTAKKSPFDTTAKSPLDTTKKILDTSKNNSFNEYLLTRKGLFGKLVKVLMTDTAKVDNEAELIRNDLRYQRYKGKIIRRILVRRLDFGIPIEDTNKRSSNFFIRLSNGLHHKTNKQVVENNLFFKANDTIQPFLLADNERYLRNLPYLYDAKISVVRIRGITDSVDILIRTKDVLSIGGEISSIAVNNTDVAVIEENFAGMGDKVTFKTLFDDSRNKKFGYGFEYIKRNISGSFIDGYVGFDNFNKSITGNKEESWYYAGITRPFVNSYIRWTYGVEASRHETRNMYSSDSLYQSDTRYGYTNFDVWARLNIYAPFLDKYLGGQRLRVLTGLRLLSQKFDALPTKFNNVYDPRYADVTGVIASISILAQDFYKIKYIYGFGRNEDVPGGLAVELTPGFIRKHNENRPYIGLKFERYYFTARQRYLDFTFRVEASVYKKKFEDVTLFGNVNFFNHLVYLGQWKQRTFLSIGFTRQLNSTLNEPLFLESKYGLPEFRNGYAGGHLRATLKGESVFYAPLSIASFRFAPFIFYNSSLFSPNNSTTSKTKMYSSIGGGLRTRNESLIFGTLELKAYYFPRTNYNHDSFKIEFNTNLKFKYDPQLGGRPEFIQVN